MKRKCRPKGLAQNPGNARQIIVHFMILRQTGAAQFMGPEPKVFWSSNAYKRRKDYGSHSRVLQPLIGNP